MANTTWKQVVYDTADAYREANGTTDKIPVGQLADKVRASAGTPYEGDNPLTIGQAGFTFPAKTLLKDGLQIINGVNGEDLTDTVADQTTAVEELMKMVNRKIAMNNGEGQYVWKKYSVENKVYQTTENAFFMGAAANSRTITIAYAKDYSFDDGTKTFRLLNPEEYEEVLTSVNENVIDGSYVIQSIDSWQDTLTEGGVMLYIPEGASTTVADCDFTIDGSGKALLIENATVYRYGEVKEFLNYVVSSDAEAYPNVGELDGYWYELEKGNPLTELGFTEFKIVDFVSTSNATTVTIPHTLGKQPTFVMLTLMDTPTQAKTTWSRIVALYTKSNNTSFFKKYVVLNMRINDSYITSGAMSESSNSTDPTVTADAESVTFKYTNGSIYFPAGLKYRLLVGI